MKRVSQRILIWCSLAAFVSCAISATPLSKSDREKKLNMALQKRDLYVLKRRLEDSVEHLAQQENRNMRTPISQSSDKPNRRGKRGCNLLTCSVHDLAYRISQLSNRMNNAPLHKISPCGYGRRRRRSLPQHSAVQTHVECHLRHDSSQKQT
ncbi:pro-adrenomedullin-like [Hemibagrus wyckioides]|uniref:pro-adrenomedullin-like n=1 Tax=Hemibagrus wyckioides TaxID=337641 RepID=UPI00266BBD77|nr:pro-adrenomedullin-like [Hemibagrus wyckioides]